MTEEEWLTCGHPAPMLQCLRGRCSGRKCRLYVFHCVRRQVWHLLDKRSKEAVTLSERLADGPVSLAEQERVSGDADAAFHTTHEKANKAAIKAANKALWPINICHAI